MAEWAQNVTLGTVSERACQHLARTTTTPSSRPVTRFRWHSYCKDEEHTFTTLASKHGGRVHGSVASLPLQYCVSADAAGVCLSVFTPFHSRLCFSPSHASLNTNPNLSFMSKLGLTPGFKFKNNHSPLPPARAEVEYENHVLITFVQVCRTEERWRAVESPAAFQRRPLRRSTNALCTLDGRPRPGRVGRAGAWHVPLRLGGDAA